LRTAPPLADLAGGAVPGRAEAPALVEQARRLYAVRQPPAVGDAASLALRAAAADPVNDAAIVLAVRALVWLADHETATAAREQAATRAVQAAQWCGAGRPPSPPCEFWLGAALGVQARERPTTGVAALPAIEAAFLAAAAGDPSYDKGAPDQALGLPSLPAPAGRRDPAIPSAVSSMPGVRSRSAPITRQTCWRWAKRSRRQGTPPEAGSVSRRRWSGLDPPRQPATRTPRGGFTTPR